MHIRYLSTLFAALLFPVAARAATFVVTDSGDSGPNTLRSAIDSANANPADSDEIVFSLSGGTGVQTIQVSVQLPSIIGPVTIDGTTQNPSGSSSPLIELDGSGSVGSTGLIIAAPATIRGLIINNFEGAGIQLQNASGVTIAGNWIGLDADGVTSAPNGSDGIQLIGSSMTTIGGAAAVDRNVISANSGYGIRISEDCDGNVVRNNYIGVTADGTVSAANQAGLLVVGADNEIRANVISGTSGGEITGLPLVQIGSSSTTGVTGNKLYENKIGTNAAGDAALTDRDTTPGVVIVDSSGNTIGGPGTGNLISGTLFGIIVNGSDGTGQAADGNVIQGNLIGTNSAGDQAIPNGAGIFLSGETANSVADNRIGGSGDGEGNVISGNEGAGLIVSGQFATLNRVVGNMIGTRPDGATALSNGSDGIALQSSSGNTIGGSGAGEGNIIAYNAGAGVVVFAGNANRISANRIFSNDELGIDLVIPTGESSGIAGVTMNDAGDADTGSNNLQNFPDISSVAVSKNDTRVKGTILGAPGSILSVELFASSAIDPTGFGEAERLLGAVGVTVAANGVGVFDTILTELLADGENVTALAIDALGNTSELSAAVRPPQIVKNGGTIAEPPGVVVVDDDATIVLQKFEPAKSRRKKSGGRRFASAAAKKAKRGGARGRSSRGTVQYQVMVRNTQTGKVTRRTTKKTTLTLSNLSPGSYSTTYRARVVQGGRVVSKTRLSPAASFTVSLLNEIGSFGRPK